MSNIAASVITIGDELLIGQTIDTNSAWIAKRLNEQGIDLRRRVAVGDNRTDIISALNEELSRSSLVIITGGLGPTADDITKPLLLEYFGGQMRVDERVLEYVQHLFRKLNRPILERNMKQAEVPDSCEVLFNSKGTAPGMWFEKDGKVTIALPGVPHEMAGIMTEEVLPKLKQFFTSDAIVHYSIITAGEGESFIAERILDLEEALPAHIRLAYLPGARMVKLRLTAKGPDEARLNRELKEQQSLFAERLANIVISLEDVPLETLLHSLFTEKKMTLGLAESCTGGDIAHHLTQVAGASDYFRGSIVCYQDDIKTKMLGVNPETIASAGVISEAVVKEMALGALTVLQADYAFAVTGLLGPESPNDKEATGTIWMAVASKDKVVSQKHHFHYDRHRNKEMATSMGMLMIYKFVIDLYPTLSKGGGNDL
jgi:nicotinamide-nucleotide amidase